MLILYMLLICLLYDLPMQCGSHTCSVIFMLYIQLMLYIGLVVTSQVPTQVMTNTSANATNPFPMITSTNQGARCCPTCHEWVWFQLEG